MPRLAKPEDLNPSPAQARSIALETLNLALSNQPNTTCPIFTGEAFSPEDHDAIETLVLTEGMKLMWMHPALLDAYRALGRDAEGTAHILAMREQEELLESAGEPLAMPADEVKAIYPETCRRALDLLGSFATYLDENAGELSRSQATFDRLKAAPLVATAAEALDALSSITQGYEANIAWHLAARAREVLTWSPGDKLSEIPYSTFCRLHAASTLIDPRHASAPDPAVFRAAKLHLAAQFEEIEDEDEPRIELDQEPSEILVAALATGIDRILFDAEIQNWSPAEVAIENLRCDRYDQNLPRDAAIALVVAFAHADAPDMSAHQRLEIYALARQKLLEAGFDIDPTEEWAEARVANVFSEFAA